MGSSLKYALLLSVIWIIACVIVNPIGEFMINDDYAFVSSLEKLTREGQLGSTGKGPAHASGGPSLVTHLAWGWLFTKIFGNSLTTLRLSVCFLGLLGVIWLFLIMKSLKAPDWMSLFASLTLMFNPLYFSQSFTFMTDITFATLIIFSIYYLGLGIQRQNTALLILGLFFSFAGMLTRQLAIIIPAAFMISCLVTSEGRRYGCFRGLLLTIAFVIGPWLAFEWFLSSIGSSPITKHEKLYDLFSYPFIKGFPDYPIFVMGQFAQSVLGYTAFLISPMIALRFGEFSRSRLFWLFVVAASMLLVILEAAILLGLINPPILLSRNVIYNFGIGPVLLKDSYLLGIPRTWSLSPALFYILVWWTIVCIGAMLVKLWESLSELYRSMIQNWSRQPSFLSVLTLLAAGGYALIVVLTDLHDRYIIPLCVLGLIWICSCSPNLRDLVFNRRLLTIASIPLIAMMLFSVLGTRDFIEIRRTVAKANYFLTTHLKANPCDFDGGFEFNGYHCYDMNHRAKSGYSWWWVKNENYVVTLGLLDGYQSVMEFPFKRIIGPNGKVHILKPAQNQ